MVNYKVRKIKFNSLFNTNSQIFIDNYNNLENIIKNQLDFTLNKYKDNKTEYLKIQNKILKFELHKFKDIVEFQKYYDFNNVEDNLNFVSKRFETICYNINKIVTHVYQFIRLYVLHYYEMNDETLIINDEFIIIVFRTLSVIKHGKTSSNKILINSVEKFFNEVYSKIFYSDKINTNNMSFIIASISTEMITCITNNIVLHFQKYFHRFINSYFEDDIQKDVDKESNDKLKKEKRKILYKELNELKKYFFEETEYNNEKFKDFIEKFKNKILPDKSKEFTYQADLLINPFNYVKPMIFMIKEMERLDKKLYQFMPLKTNFNYRYFIIDTSILINNFTNLTNYIHDYTEELKQCLWNMFFDLGHNIFKEKKLFFDYYLETDLMGCSVRFLDKENKEKVDKTKLNIKNGKEKYKNLTDEEKKLKKQQDNDNKKNKKIKNVKNKTDNKKKNKEEKDIYKKNLQNKKEYENLNTNIEEKQKQLEEKLNKCKKGKTKTIINLEKSIENLKEELLKIDIVKINIDILNYEEKQRKANINKEFKYFTDITDDEFNECYKNYVVIDPGKRNIYTMYNEEKGKLIYSSKQRNKDLKKYRNQNNNLKYIKKNNMQPLLDELSDCNSKSCNIEKFKKYIEVRNKNFDVLTKLYNESDLRKIKWNTYNNTRRTENNLINSIIKKYGKNVTLFIGDWSKGSTNLKNFQSTPRIGLLRKLRCYFKVYLINEYLTSKIHNETHKETENLEIKIKVNEKLKIQELNKEKKKLNVKINENKNDAKLKDKVDEIDKEIKKLKELSKLKSYNKYVLKNNKMVEKIEEKRIDNYRIYRKKGEIYELKEIKEDITEEYKKIKLHSVLTYKMETKKHECNNVGCIDRDINSCKNMISIIKEWKYNKKRPTYLIKQDD